MASLLAQKFSIFIVLDNLACKASRTFMDPFLKKKSVSLAPRKIGPLNKRIFERNKVVAYFKGNPDAALCEAAAHVNAGKKHEKYQHARDAGNRTGKLAGTISAADTKKLYWITGITTTHRQRLIS